MECRFANRTLYSYPILHDAAAGFAPAMRRKQWIAYAAGAILVVGAVLLVAQLSLFSLLAIPVLVIALGFLGFGYFSGKGNQTAFRNRIVQNTPSRRMEYEFFEEHFLTRVGEEEVSREYSDLTRWYRGSRTITLCAGEELFILDRDEFQTGNAADFCRFLAQRIS